MQEGLQSCVEFCSPPGDFLDCGISGIRLFVIQIPDCHEVIISNGIVMI